MRYAVFLVVLAACPHPKAEDTAPGKPATPTEVVAAVRGAIEQWRQAYEVRSIDALEKLYARDPDVVLVQGGQPLIGWTSVDAMLKDWLAHAKEIHVRLKEVQVAARGDEVATAVTTMTRELSDGTTTVSENGALTLVLHKDPEGWHIVLEHFSYKRPN